jgi:FAD/FMN-containing dehydrogenase
MPGSLHPPANFRGTFRDDADARAVYAEAAGIGRITPRAIAVPQDADEVSALVTWARSEGQPLISRGSGSGMASGAIGDGVVLDLSRLRSIADPEPSQRSISAGSGAIRGELQRRAAAVRLRFPVDPSSGEFCTVGGMAATNAAGPHSLLHGPMRPWVLALDCVFADGSRAMVRRGSPPPNIEPVRRFMRDVHSAIIAEPRRPSATLKNSSGYAANAYAESQELVDLLVGSEGTLAIFTGIEVALIPSIGASASLMVSFRSLEDATQAAIRSRAAGAAACELLDKTFLVIASKAGKPLPVASDAEAALLVEVEASDSATAAAELDRLRTAFKQNGACDVIVAVLPQDEHELWSFRHAASPAIARMDPALRSMQFIEDAAVPPDALPDYVRGVREILARHETAGVVFGHAGDAHVHVNPLVDVARPDWRHRVEAILEETTALVAELDGTTSGEHGDGRLRTPLLARTWSANECREFTAIKRAFDPEGVLNPGVKVPMSGQRAIDVVKYDPALDPHPPAAQRALAVVERERAYARFRLDLL